MNSETPIKSLFETLAHHEMDFLCSDFGFRCVMSRPDLLRYESSTVFFEFGHASYDREVYAIFGRHGAPGAVPDQPSERLDLSMFLAVVDTSASRALEREVPYACTSSDDQIGPVLSFFARGLKTHGLGLLTADDTAYEYARKLRFWDAPGWDDPVLIQERLAALRTPPQSAPEEPQLPRDQQKTFDFKDGV